MLMVWTELSTYESEQRMVFMRKLEMEDIFTEKLIFDVGFRQSRGTVSSFRIETISFPPTPFNLST